MQTLIHTKRPFELRHATIEQAKTMFSYNKHKLAILNNLPTSQTISIYKCGYNKQFRKKTQNIRL